jgi:hypothetical protein
VACDGCNRLLAAAGAGNGVLHDTADDVLHDTADGVLHDTADDVLHDTADDVLHDTADGAQNPPALVLAASCTALTWALVLVLAVLHGALAVTSGAGCLLLGTVTPQQRQQQARMHGTRSSSYPHCQ